MEQSCAVYVYSNGLCGGDQTDIYELSDFPRYPPGVLRASIRRLLHNLKCTKLEHPRATCGNHNTGNPPGGPSARDRRPTTKLGGRRQAHMAVVNHMEACRAVAFGHVGVCRNEVETHRDRSWRASANAGSCRSSVGWLQQQNKAGFGQVYAASAKLGGGVDQRGLASAPPTIGHKPTRSRSLPSLCRPR